MTMYAIKATADNLSLIQKLAPNPTWFNDFMKIFVPNFNNNKGTYFIMQTRKTGNGEKTFYSWMNESKFNETFAFTRHNPQDLAPITKK